MQHNRQWGAEAGGHPWLEVKRRQSGDGAAGLLGVGWQGGWGGQPCVCHPAAGQRRLVHITAQQGPRESGSTQAPEAWAQNSLRSLLTKASRRLAQIREMGKQTLGLDGSNCKVTLQSGMLTEKEGLWPFLQTGDPGEES